MRVEWRGSAKHGAVVVARGRDKAMASGRGSSGPPLPAIRFLPMPGAQDTDLQSMTDAIMGNRSAPDYGR